jgi:cell division protein FtsW (lipid II flippase)
MTGDLPDRFWPEVVALTGLALGAYVGEQIWAPWASQVILPGVVLLNGVGLAMILRIEQSGSAFARGANAGNQTLWSAVGVLAACVIIILLDEKRMQVLRRHTLWAALASIFFLGLPFIPGLGQEVNGSRIWITIAGRSFQPAEFAKIALVVFFASYLSRNRDTLALAGPKILGLQLPRIRDLGPLVVVWAMSILVLVKQTDLGTSLLLFGMFLAMVYLATQRMSWVIIGMVLFIGGAIVAVRTFNHVAERFAIWTHAFDNSLYNRPFGGSGQLVGGLFAMANGGMLGTGWGRGSFPFLYAASFSDFIYTGLGEELGLTGLLAILVVYLLLVERGLRTAITVRDDFGKLLAAGVAFIIALQTFIVIGGVTRIIPSTGSALPFLAQGGSSLLAHWIVAGLLIRISDMARRPSAAPARGVVAQGRIVSASEAAMASVDEAASAAGEAASAAASVGASEAVSGPASAPAGDPAATASLPRIATGHPGGPGGDAP